MFRRAARPSLAPLLLLGSALGLGFGCSLTVGVDGYAGGDADATLDTAEVEADSGAPDTAIDDTGAPDSGALDTAIDDTGTLDSGATDTGAVDSGVVDSTVVDSATDTSDVGPADSTPGDSATDAADAPDADPCATPSHVLLSEIMVRAVSGSGDAHEWFEITNYDATCTYDVGGLWARTSSYSGTSFVERGRATVPAGVKLAPGESLLFVDAKATFLTDAASYLSTNAIDTARILDLAKTGGDLLVNSADNMIEIYAAGAALPIDSVIVKARGTTWPALSRSFAFPTSCDPSLRLSAAAPYTTSAHWIDTPNLITNQYGTAGTTPVYGTPLRPNAVAASCL